MRIHREGFPFIAGALLVGVLLLAAAREFGSVLFGMLAGAGFLAALFCAYFFRDPRRTPPAGDQLIVSPADGVILEITEGKDAAAAEPVWIMRIFLSVFDPHIQRMPVRGVIERIQYTKGCFLDARHPRACIENEQNRVEIRPAAGRWNSPVIVTQIAGLIARRIVCWAKEGQSLEAGERFGLIRFGSQVDLVFSRQAQLKVRGGDRVVAGETVLAEIG